MQRSDYLAHKDVEAFVRWASHLLNGDWHLEHSWKGKGPAFECHTIYGAFQHYLWPNSTKGDTFAITMQKFSEFRCTFDEIGTIDSAVDRQRFVETCRNVAAWGGITLPKLNEWARMEPQRLNSHIEETKSKLNPARADTNDLRGFKYMSSGFSKIYAALVPGFTIYDSRVACALTCLVKLYCKSSRLSSVPPTLTLGVPPGRGGTNRCKRPPIYSAEATKYAQANLKATWLLSKLVERPGQFEAVPESRRVDALQSALFMIGHSGLKDDSIPELRRQRYRNPSNTPNIEAP